MNLLDSSIHSFIVKIWLEETVEEDGRALWRGHITHVPSGKRKYVKGLNDIIVFIIPYLEGMGVKFGLHWRLKMWFKRVRALFGRVLSRGNQ